MKNVTSRCGLVLIVAVMLMGCGSLESDLIKMCTAATAAQAEMPEGTAAMRGEWLFQKLNQAVSGREAKQIVIALKSAAPSQRHNILVVTAKNEGINWSCPVLERLWAEEEARSQSEKNK